MTTPQKPDTTAEMPREIWVAKPLFDADGLLTPTLTKESDRQVKYTRAPSQPCGGEVEEALEFAKRLLTDYEYMRQNARVGVEEAMRQEECEYIRTLITAAQSCAEKDKEIENLKKGFAELKRKNSQRALENARLRSELAALKAQGVDNAL